MTLSGTHSRKSSVINGMMLTASPSVALRPATIMPSKLYSIIDFLGQCSRFELDWLIGECTSFLSTTLQAIKVNPDVPLAYDAIFSPAGIHVEKARRQVYFPPPSTSAPLGSAASLLAGFIIDCSRDEAFTNKASRMRTKIAALTVLKGSHLRLTRSGALSEEVLGLLQQWQRLFIFHSQIPATEILESRELAHIRYQLPDDSADFVPSPVASRGAFGASCPRAIVVTRPSQHPVNFPSDRLSTLVIPSAGRSSRFPGHKPKWLLTMPNGRLMVVDALAKLDLSRVKRVVLGVLKEHVEKHCKSDISALIKAFEDGPPELADVELSVVVIEQETVDQVQTIESILKAANVTGPIYLKDCDNQFVSDIPGADGIATLEISKEMQNLNIPAGKSYISPDSEGNIDNIVEKVILGPHFCVGGYSFAKAEDFMKDVATAREYQTLTSATKIELAVSDIVWLKLITSFCLRSQEDTSQAQAEFKMIPVSGYEDWGTLQAWEAYARTFRTLFLDIDGTLVKNSGQYFAPTWGMQPPLPKTVEHLQELHAKGRTQIILTTSRPESFREVTVQQLVEHAIPYDQIIFGMFHAQRIVVNDFAKTNPFPSAASINLRRDGDELAEMLGSY